MSEPRGTLMGYRLKLRDPVVTMASMNFLRPVQLKLARAEAHARGLADSIQSWTTSNELRAHCELREERLGFRLVLEEFDEAPPLEVNLCAGAPNRRSAYLAGPRSRAPPARELQSRRPSLKDWVP